MTRRRRKSVTLAAVAVITVVVIGAVAVLTWYQHRPQPVVATVEKQPPPPKQESPITVLNNEENKEPNKETAPAPRLRAGQFLGRIEIPRLRVATQILEGTSEAELKRGAGHVPSTALPGAAGNMAIAAHRDKFFRALRNIRASDEIMVDTPRGVYHYVVRKTEIVTPKDVRVLQPTATPQLTLVTCYPFYYVGHAPKRFIVHAERSS